MHAYVCVSKSKLMSWESVSRACMAPKTVLAVTVAVPLVGTVSTYLQRQGDGGGLGRGVRLGFGEREMSLT